MIVFIDCIWYFVECFDIMLFFYYVKVVWNWLKINYYKNWIEYNFYLSILGYVYMYYCYWNLWKSMIVFKKKESVV